MKKAVLFSAVMATGLMVAQANAALLTVTDGPDAGVDAAFNNTTDFTSVTFNPTLDIATTGIVYEIPVYVQVSNLGTDSVGTQTGFGAVDVSAATTGGVTIDSYGYFPNNPQYTSGKSMINYFNQNTVATATLSSTYEDIVASLSAGVNTPSDPNYSIANGSPFLIGDIYVDVAKGGTVTLTTNAFDTNDGGTLVEVYGAQSDHTGSAVSPGLVNFVVPEPASLSMLGIGAIGLLARKRRQA